MIFREYVKESTKCMNENSEAVELRKHLHDQQIKYAAAAKRKDKSAMDFWNKAIKNTEEELKYYDNENFSSTSSSEEDEDRDANDPIKRMEGMVDIEQKKNLVDSIKILAKDFEDEGAELSDVKKYLYLKLGIGPVKPEFYQRWRGLVTIDADKKFLTNARSIRKDAEDEGMSIEQIHSYMKDLINKSLSK